MVLTGQVFFRLLSSINTRAKVMFDHLGALSSGSGAVVRAEASDDCVVDGGQTQQG